MIPTAFAAVYQCYLCIFLIAETDIIQNAGRLFAEPAVNQVIPDTSLYSPISENYSFIYVFISTTQTDNGEEIT